MGVSQIRPLLEEDVCKTKPFMLLDSKFVAVLLIFWLVWEMYFVELKKYLTASLCMTTVRGSSGIYV
jgi:hypothetical protein